MKKALLILFASCMAVAGFAQTCVRDSSILHTGGIVTPKPWTPDTPAYNLHLACINDPYLQSITFNIPDSITAMGLPLALNSISIATTGAISGLPIGVTYLCDPPNCVFPKKTLGCLLLYGTPTSANTTPDTLSLSITISVSTPSFPFPIPIQFPGTVAPNNYYYLIVRPHGECVMGTHDPDSQILAVQNAPNPFGSETVFTIESAVTGNFKFEVFNALGQHVYADDVRILTGQNKFTFDAGNLPNGLYYYAIGNPAGKITRMMVISR